MFKNKKILFIIAGLLFISILAFVYSSWSPTDIKNPFTQSPVNASLKVTPNTVNTLINPPKQINIANIDKANVTISITNKSDRDIIDPVVSLIVVNKSNDYNSVHLGSTTTRLSRLNLKTRGGVNGILINILTPIRVGATRNVNAFIFSTARDTFEVQAALISEEHKIRTNKETVTFN